MKYFIILFVVCSLLCTSCEKFLEAKPDSKINTPSTIADLNGMLDNYFDLNQLMPVLAEVSADNYYVTDASWASSTELHRNLYYWQKFDQTRADWNKPYKAILIANTILEHLPKLQDQNIALASIIESSAYFIRGYQHFVVAQHFANTYNKASAAKDPGIPLRLNTSYSESSERGTVEVTYQQIVNDLLASIAHLPEYPQQKYRPSKPAAYGALARCYLVMQNYADAALYADSCLRLYHTLIDYNAVNAAAAVPFKQFNDEVIYETVSSAASILAQTRAKVDTLLFRSYANGDLRKTAFFKKNTDSSYAFKGNYTGLATAAMFTGIATDEIYLIRAEANARQGKLQAAADDMNALLRMRWNKTAVYIPFAAASVKEALGGILQERRKELLFRNIRWSDLRRLNLENEWRVLLVRRLNNKEYILQPNDKRYTLQISDQAIIYSTMQQNP